MWSHWRGLCGPTLDRRSNSLEDRADKRYGRFDSVRSVDSRNRIIQRRFDGFFPRDDVY